MGFESSMIFSGFINLAVHPTSSYEASNRHKELRGREEPAGWKKVGRSIVLRSVFTEVPPLRLSPRNAGNRKSDVISRSVGNQIKRAGSDRQRQKSGKDL